MTGILIFLKYLWSNKTFFVIGLFCLICISFYGYYSYASDKISSLNFKNIELSRIIEEKNKIIESLKKDYETILVSKEELNFLLDRGNQEIESLRKKLFREERGKKSLSELAIKKSILIENAVNKSTENVIRCFETISKNGDC